MIHHPTTYAASKVAYGAFRTLDEEARACADPAAAAQLRDLAARAEKVAAQLWHASAQP